MVSCKCQLSIVKLSVVKLSVVKLAVCRHLVLVCDQGCNITLSFWKACPQAFEVFLFWCSIGCLLSSLCQHLIHLSRYFSGPGRSGYFSWNSLSFCGQSMKFQTEYQVGSES
jgi:hypothetical protein